VRGEAWGQDCGGPGGLRWEPHKGGAHELRKILWLDTSFIEIFRKLCSAVTARLEYQAHTSNRKMYPEDDTFQSHAFIQSKFACEESRTIQEIIHVTTTTNENTCFFLQCKALCRLLDKTCKWSHWFSYRSINDVPQLRRAIVSRIPLHNIENQSEHSYRPYQATLCPASLAINMSDH